MESTWHIHIKGLVQGVGFRPFVHQSALVFDLTGWVSNTKNGLRIEFNSDEKKAIEFYKCILNKAPKLSVISNHQLLKIRKKTFHSFEIIHRKIKRKTNLHITPDFTVCKKCIAETNLSEDRRHGYCFTSCTECGPRFSIYKKLPFDRENTSLKTFEMCYQCKEEYENINDRRYFSQTNSCEKCGVQQRLYDHNNHLISIDPNEVIEKVTSNWLKGKIIAIKGIGGYLLTCDSTNPEAILKLRKRKKRLSKPFALMYPNIDFIKQEHDISLEEEKSLKSLAAPIVLVKPKKKFNQITKKIIAPNLKQIGVMLPNTALFYLLLNKFNHPIIATSGNLNNSSIIFKDRSAINELLGVYDFILTNTLDIAVPQDDSVIKYTQQSQRIILRRSRGLSPGYFSKGLNLSKHTFLTTGASIKSTFCLKHRDTTFISQFLGDLNNFDNLTNYISTITHVKELFDCEPNIILSDLHPNYHSTHYGEKLAKKLDVPFYKVQHHLAHFSAVLGENRLHNKKKSVLGVIWDGHGYGDDGEMWGGEFFVFANLNFKRVLHFSYFETILGDKMAKNPSISALSCCSNLKKAEALLNSKFTSMELNLYNKKISNKNNIKTSSMGRIIDAVASLLDLIDTQTFEGEAALILEGIAQDYFDENQMYMEESYFNKKSYIHGVSTQDLMSAIIDDIIIGKKKQFIAAKFFFSLTTLINSVADELQIKSIAFSGGVFQNRLLMDLIIFNLKKKFKLYFHKELSPNDENISFGQLIYYHIKNS